MGRQDVIDDEGPRSFAVFIDQLADGRANEDLSVELMRLGQAIRRELDAERDAKGELNLKLKFKVSRNGIVAITYDIKLKEPPRLTMPGTNWLTDGGNFVGANPRQPTLPGIREVPPRRDEARDVGADLRVPKEV